jgi:hypothetical protein
MVINGSGSITGLSAGGLPDGTIQQADLATNVAGNGPAFLVYRSGDQTISTNTWTKLQLNAEEFDTNNNFDSTTNYRFTPTVSGYYQFSSAIFYSGSATFGRCRIAVYKNGSSNKTTIIEQTANYINTITATNSCLLYMNGSTDYVEVYGYSDNASSPTFVGGGGGASGGGSDQIFFENDQTVTANYTIPTGKNAGTFGPITINDGVTVTVPDGDVWTIV